MVVDGLSDARPYVGRVTLNGAPLERSFIRHDEIMSGGTLHFTMSASPDKTWATRPQARPYSMTPYPG